MEGDLLPIAPKVWSGCDKNNQKLLISPDPARRQGNADRMQERMVWQTFQSVPNVNILYNTQE
jgi:hypothetical protein